MAINGAARAVNAQPASCRLRGRSYRSVIRRKGRDRLEVKGCIAFLCQTQVWTRAR